MRSSEIEQHISQRKHEVPEHSSGINSDQGILGTATEPSPKPPPDLGEVLPRMKDKEILLLKWIDYLTRAASGLSTPEN